MLRGLILIALLLRGISLHARDEKLELTPLDEVDESKATGVQIQPDVLSTNPADRVTKPTYFHAEYFRKRTKPAPPPVADSSTPLHDPQIVDYLVEKLASDDWEVRARAFKHLSAIAKFIIPDLTSALKIAADLEQKTRLQELLLREADFGPTYEGLAVKIYLDPDELCLGDRLRMTVLCRNSLKQTLIVRTGWGEIPDWDDLVARNTISSSLIYRKIYRLVRRFEHPKARFIVIPPESTYLETCTIKLPEITCIAFPSTYCIRLVLPFTNATLWKSDEALKTQLGPLANDVVGYAGGAFSNEVTLKVGLERPQE